MEKIFWLLLALGRVASFRSWALSCAGFFEVFARWIRYGFRRSRDVSLRNRRSK
jgi:hypothetical protein